MPISFRIAEHQVHRGVQIVELLLEGDVIGVIYPHEEQAIRIASAHVSERALEPGFAGEVVAEDPARAWPPIPSFLVRFDPSPYEIVGNRIVKHPKQS